jgi:hypothetical protein
MYTNDTTRYTSYLDLHLNIDSGGWLGMKHNGKRDYCIVLTVNVSFICSNNPVAPAYEVNIS